MHLFNQMNPAQKLINLGQSIWYDNISRELIDSGELQNLVNNLGVRGVTSNPSIFDNAISKGNSYDSLIKELKTEGKSSDEIFEEIAVKDIADACDILLPIYKESNGIDGYVSIEVSPLLASNTEGTISEAKRLYAKVNRPNVMIKIPGTKEGLPAIAKVISEGISVNVTLLFSVENYIEVAKAYTEGITRRLEDGKDISKIHSVASFFVSRVDGVIDSKLEQLDLSQDEKDSLKGKFGIANCKLAYLAFKEHFTSNEFSKLKESGANIQRPLWASTSTKNPEYSDVLYIDELIGSDTVNTIPDVTLRAFADHGNASITLENNLDLAIDLPKRLQNLGINLNQILDELQSKGVSQFVDSFKSLNETINNK